MRTRWLPVLLLLLSVINHPALLSAQAQTHTQMQTLALVNGRVYRSPDEPPIERGTVVISDGRIVATGASADVKPPAGATVIDCTGLSVTAGFWNSHVHFVGLQWEQAAAGPADSLSASLDTMLTRHGVTSVMDTGSYWEITSALRARIERHEIRGPRILTAGEIIFPKGAMPGDPPPNWMQRPMFEAGSPAETSALVQRKLDQGVDAIKLYVATWWGNPPQRLPVPVIAASAKLAHARGKLVLAHPSDRQGINDALEGGVDIIVHTAPKAGVWDAALIARMRQQNVAIVPTLKLWREELVKENAPPEDVKAFQGRGIAQLGAFVKAGGDVLFGTDVGYMAYDDVTEEIAKMGEAGMTARQILASLTTTPARRFGVKNVGELKAGADADVVLLDGNPDADLLALTRVRRVIRGGRTIWTSATNP
jgi:imidazolonepropionase-like amidohydrolase